MSISALTGSGGRYYKPIMPKGSGGSGGRTDEAGAEADGEAALAASLNEAAHGASKGTAGIWDLPKKTPKSVYAMAGEDGKGYRPKTPNKA